MRARPQSRFAQQPKRQRIKKSVADYQRHSDELEQSWTTITRICPEAQRFNDAIAMLADLHLLAGGAFRNG